MSTMFISLKIQEQEKKNFLSNKYSFFIQK